MRSLLIALAGFLVASSAQAQDRIQPSLRSTFVVPAHPGEVIRVTEYARRPTQRGRLSRRYRGLRANRTPRVFQDAVRFQPVSPIYRTPHHSFVRRNGAFFPVAPRR